MKTLDFDYLLPPELIAQTPVEPRDYARLMVLDRSRDTLSHNRFFNVADYLQAGDVLVLNNSRVIPARLQGHRADSGGKVEILLLRRLGPGTWETLTRPAKRLKTGSRLELAGNISNAQGGKPPVQAEVIETRDNGRRVLHFSDESQLPALGIIPLPPYIHTPLKTPGRYQTVYARPDGSVAAPTAGLHFTPELLASIEERGIQCLFITLHIGLDTFLPVREEDPTTHPIHREYGQLSPEAALELTQARKEGRRIICVGTTTVRLVEAAAGASEPNHLEPFEDWVDLFILPGYEFQMTDGLITNFHLPRSTLLMLVTAFAGSDLIKQAYQEAISQEYRFYSFGDAMLIH